MTFPVERENRDGVWVVTVNRPGTKNAVDPSVHAGLLRVVEEAERNQDVRAIVLQGGGQTFLSGGDLKYIARYPMAETLPLSAKMTALLDRWAALPCLTIAAIEGYCFGGGCEIMLACDVRVAAEDARFSFRHTAMGLTTGWGALTRMRPLVGKGVALRLLMTAEVFSAEHAYRVGLVDECTASTEALAEALRVGRATTRVSPAAARQMKALIHQAYASTTDVARAAEWEAFAARWGSSDHQEALSAFFEGRPPLWKE